MLRAMFAQFQSWLIFYLSLMKYGPSPLYISQAFVPPHAWSSR